MADAAKVVLRREALLRRGALPPERRRAYSAAICEAVAALPEYRAAEAVLFYMPTRDEVDVLPLLARAQEEGKRCALPRCCAGRALRCIWVRDLRTDVEEGTWGIVEPKIDDGRECFPGDFSVIIVPGVAFDDRGGRIGYGAGYYDRFLALPHRAATIAPAFSAQVVPTVPREAADVPVDILVTEAGVTHCQRIGRE